jgi:hypothetical protein
MQFIRRRATEIIINGCAYLQYSYQAILLWLKKRYIKNVKQVKPVGFFAYLDKKALFAIKIISINFDNKKFFKAWIH